MGCAAAAVLRSTHESVHVAGNQDFAGILLCTGNALEWSLLQTSLSLGRCAVAGRWHGSFGADHRVPRFALDVLKRADVVGRTNQLAHEHPDRK